MARHDGSSRPGRPGISETTKRLAATAWTAIKARFTVDTRALAALRIALGLILLADLVHRAGHLGTFYTDAGMYPRAAYEATYLKYTGLSVHALSGPAWFQGLLFTVAGAFAVALVLGYRTRLVGLVSFLLLFSLHARNPTVLNGGDRLLRVLLLVALVTPLGERWSIDALRRGSARTKVASFGTAAVLVQPLAVFTTNAIEKHRGDTWFAGEALEVALNNDVMTVYLGNVLPAFPGLLTVMTYAWVTLLAGSILFLLVPTGRLRAASALVYMGAFAGMATTLAVGLFPFVLAASVIPYLASPFWDTLAAHTPADWSERLPRRHHLDPLSGPPLERRALRALEARGHTFTARYLESYARTSAMAAGAIVLAWILVFSSVAVTDTDLPESIDNPHLHQQHWGLYAPNPSAQYSWYVTEAYLENGESIDAVDGGPVDLDPPPDAADAYETFRHRKAMESVRDSANGDPGVVASAYADWTCRQAARNADAPVDFVSLHRMIQNPPVDGELEPPGEFILFDHECPSEDPTRPPK